MVQVEIPEVTKLDGETEERRVRPPCSNDERTPMKPRTLPFCEFVNEYTEFSGVVSMGTT